jgi:4-amino-4-deoxy-L-arabinose transferase-like glycosyltransferase
MFSLVVVVAGVLLTRSWQASLLDRYEFRQLQTALSTHWIAAEGWRLDYPTPLFGPPWSVPMEFPTYQVIVATVHHVTGLPLEQTGRLVGIFFLGACLPALFDLLGLAGLRPSRRLIVLALVLSSPVYLFYARTFMIETTALAFAVWFLALFRRALERPHWGWITATTLLATLAALTKITTFLVFGLPAVALAFTAWQSARPTTLPARRAVLLLVALVPAAVSLGLAWWWIRHGDTVKDSNPFTGFLAARELRAWNFGTWALRTDLSFWIKLQENIVRYNLAEGAIAIALLGAPFAPVRTRWIAGAALLGFASGPLVFANLYHIHDYYYAANSLLLLTAAGLMLASVWDDVRLPRGTNWLALGLVLVFQWHAFYRGYYSHHRNPAPAPPELAHLIRQAVPADGVVLIYGADWDPLLPYYAGRRAVMVPGGREGETAVLEQVLARLPPRQISAMVIHGAELRGRTDFIRERAGRFGLAPQAVARSATDELYLPSALDPEVRTKLTAPPVDDAFTASLKTEALESLDLTIFHPAPYAVRGKYGVGVADLDGRRVLNAHAPSELAFRPAAGARHLRAVAGLPDAAFAPGRAAITDGITIEVLAVSPGGSRQVLYHRRLDPAHLPGDRGAQVIELELPQPFAGDLLLRLGNGPDNNPTNDWAYWASVEIR